MAFEINVISFTLIYGFDPLMNRIIHPILIEFSRQKLVCTRYVDFVSSL